MLVERARAVIRHRSEEGTIEVKHDPPAEFPHLYIFLNQPRHQGVYRHEPYLVALSFDPEMHHALAALHVLYPQLTQLITAKVVVAQGGEYRPVPNSFERIEGRGIEEPPRLRITKGRGAAFVAVRKRPLDAIHRITQNRVTFAEVIEQGG